LRTGSVQPAQAFWTRNVAPVTSDEPRSLMAAEVQLGQPENALIAGSLGAISCVENRRNLR
jgi:hypothetical protein